MKSFRKSKRLFAFFAVFGYNKIMEKKVLAFINENHIMAGADHVVLAVSGGADSMALAHFMLCHFPQYHYVIAHVHHGLRVEADEEADFVKAFAEEHRVEFRCIHVDIKSLAEERRQGIEETGREERYRFFRSLGCDRILTAHHKDDDAETVLFHILRGCGVHGLGGMAPIGVDIGRPFLCVTKEEILSYCEKYCIDFRVDSSNEDTTYTRNRIRREVMPLLREINPGITDALYRLSASAVEDNDYLERKAKKYYENSVCGEGEYRGFRIDADFRKEPALARRMVRLALAECGVATDFEHTEAIRRLRVGKSMPISGGVWCYRERNRYLFGPKRKKAEAVVSVALPIEGQVETEKIIVTVCPADGNEMAEVSSRGIFNRAWLMRRAVLRSRRNGDYVVLPNGNRKKLSDYFIDEKVPVVERDAVLLLAVENRILWVVGYRFFASEGEEPCIVNIKVKD